MTMPNITNINLLIKHLESIKDEEFDMRYAEGLAGCGCIKWHIEFKFDMRDDRSCISWLGIPFRQAMHLFMPSGWQGFPKASDRQSAINTLKKLLNGERIHDYWLINAREEEAKLWRQAHASDISI